MIARRPGTRRPARRGVSLIEVILATAIFLIALSGISVLIRSATDNALDAARTNQCSRLARSKMAELEAGVGDATVTDGGTGVFAEYPNYQWEVVTTQAVIPNAYDITVRVWIETPSRTTEVRLSQILLDPTLLNNAAPLQAPTTETP